MPRFPRFCAFAALVFCAATPVSRAIDAPSVSNSSRLASGLIPRSTKAFRAMGLLGAGASFQRVRLLPPSASVANAPRSAQGTRNAAADGPLTFTFTRDKYTAEQINVLSSVVRASYPLLTAIYGEPAAEQKGKTIIVTDDGSSSAFAPRAVPNATDGGTIFFRYDNLSSAKTNQYNFTRLVLLSFQGPNNFSYNYLEGNYVEAWQLGMADAASLLVLYRGLSAAEQATFDPSVYGFVYALPVYDLLNRPELSNAYVFPRDTPRSAAQQALNDDSRLGDFRIAMAQSAWLKVAVENPDFFKNFNVAYRAQVPARQAVTQGQLRGIAASVVPQVEGLGFQDWVRRQYVLDNTVTAGDKIYALVAPEPVLTQAGQEAGLTVFAEAFTTDKNGDENRVVGLGTIDAFDESNVNINTKSIDLNPSNLFDFNADNFPLFFTNLGNPNRARVTLKLRFKGAQTTSLFPFIGAGIEASKTTVYGVSQNGDTGSVALSGGVPNETAPIARGVFAATQNYAGGPRVVSTLTLGGRTFKRNTAWLPGGSRGVAVVLDGASANNKFTLTTAAGASTIRMISLPIFPTQSDEATILGISAAQLKLAKYRPNLSPGTLNNGVLTFGIGAGDHELYPNISAPMAPGRGYWLGVGQFTRDIFGSEPPANKPFEIALPGGWNQFGVPFNRSFSPSAIKVRFGSFAPVSYAEAVRTGLVAPGIWRWQPRGGYVRADVDPGATLPPFEGFYIFAAPARGVSLVFDPASTASARTSAERTASSVEDGWSVDLSAATDSARDGSNRFGVSNRVAAAKPPVAAPVVTLRFASSGNAASDASGAGAATGWADSFLAEMKREASWKFSVEGARRSERVTLSWDGLGDVPSDVKLVLRDEKLKKNLALAPGGSYKFGSDGTARQFSLLATRVAVAELQISKAPSNKVNVAVSLSLEARGRLEIQTPSGDTVFVLKNGVFGAKTETFGWGGARSDGKSAPRGRYRAVWVPVTPIDKSAARDFDWR